MLKLNAQVVVVDGAPDRYLARVINPCTDDGLVEIVCKPYHQLGDRIYFDEEMRLRFSEDQLAPTGFVYKKA